MKNESEKFKKEFISRLINFSINTLKFSEKLLKHKNLWSVSDQLIRSSTSVGANVVEAKAASSKKDYVKYFQIALKSANETKYWLYLVIQYKSELHKDAQKLLDEIIEISNILGSSLLTLKGRK